MVTRGAGQGGSSHKNGGGNGVIMAFKEAKGQSSSVSPVRASQSLFNVSKMKELA